MKKIQIYNIVFGAVIFLYVLCFVLNLCGIREFHFIIDYWFSIFLMMMGVLVLARGVLFYSDSSWLAGISLTLIGVVVLLKDLFLLKFYYVLPLLLASVSIALLVVYLLFKNKLYLKCFCVAISLTIVSCVGYVF